MAVPSRPTSTSSTDPESLILQGKDVKSKKGKKSTKSKSKKQKKSQKQQKQRHASSQRARRPYATLTILSTLLLALASAASIVFSVLATAILHLQVSGDVPSRIAVFGASIVSVGLTVVQAIALCSRSNSLLSACLLINRLVLLTWIAAVVLTGIEVAKTVKDAAISSTLAAQAVYLNMLLSGVGFIATAVLSFCLEMATRKSKQVHQDDDDDVDSLLNRSVSQRGSMTSEKTVDTVDDIEATADVEPRPKKLLFSYKATTQLMDDTPASRRASMIQTEPVRAPQPVVEPTVRQPTSIKRKPIKSMVQTVPSAADRRKSVMPPAASAMFSDPFADPVENPFSDSNRIKSKPALTTTTTPASRRLSKMPTQSLPKLITSVAPVTAASTFYLDSSGSSNYDNDEDKEDNEDKEDQEKGQQQLDVNRTSMSPYSPAVTRPLSIVPPMPQVPVPKVPSTLVPVPQTAAVPKRKPVGSAPASAAAGPIKRKPVPSMVATKAAVPKTEPMEPLSPMSQPTLTVPLVPTLPSSSSSLSSPTTQLSMHFASAVSSRKSSNASEISESDASMFSMSSSYSTPSLADMVASSLRRVSVVDAPTSTTRASLDVSSAVSKAFVGAAPLPTRSVVYAQPRVLDQPIVRKSFIATTNGGGNGSEANSRRPSEVSIMETIYSPAEDESERNERSEDKNKEEVENDDYDELAAMVRQEAEAAAAAADAGRRWLEPSRESMREPPSQPQRVERTLSVSKHLSKKPSLSPVEEKEQESTDEETEETEESVDGDFDEDDTEEENPSIHTIVVHEPVGFTATGLSRTASRMRKAALQAAGAKSQAVSSSTTTAAYTPAYTRRRLSTANNYNFSRPMRPENNRVSTLSTMSSTLSSSANKRASLVVPAAVPQTSLLVSPRSRVRRQLLQMLPVQHRPAAVAVSRSVKAMKPVKVTTPRKGRQSLSGRRHRRSLSLNLVAALTESDSDSELSSSSSSSRSSSPSRRSTSLAKTATRARRRNRAQGGHLAGLRSSTLRPSSSYKRMSAGSMGSRSPYTPHNRPISPMTVLMERR